MQRFSRFVSLYLCLFIAMLSTKLTFAQTIYGCSSGCVPTYGYSNDRNNVNGGETVLKAGNLSLPNITTSPDLNGAIYAQPLYLSVVTITGKTGGQNVVFVATEENEVYALDGGTLAIDWTANLNQTGENPVPDTQLHGPPGGCTNIPPEVGITGTPVIDTYANPPVLYAVSKTINASNTITQRLNAINTSSGNVIATLDVGSVISALSPQDNNQRAGLALTHDSNNHPFIVVAWGSHCDAGMYTGVVGLFKLSGTTLSLVTSFDDEGTGPANGPDGGIWMSGSAPAIDDSGESLPSHDAYLAVGNGFFNGSTRFGESVLSLHYPAGGMLTVNGSYTPKLWQTLNQGTSGSSGTGVNLNLPLPYASGTTTAAPADFDLGSGGVALARPQGFTLPSDNFVVLAGGKEGVFYVNSPSKMIATQTSNSGAADSADPCSSGGTYSPVQCFSAMAPTLPYGAADYGSRGSIAFWSGNATTPEDVLYVAGAQDSLIRGWQMDTTAANGSFVVNSNSSQQYGMFGSVTPAAGKVGYPSSSPVISWNSAATTGQDAILWILDTTGYQNNGSAPKPAKLYAYKATPNLLHGTFQPTTGFSSDTTNGPGATKFTLPTVINAHVYVAGQKAGTTCNTSGALGDCIGKVVSWH